MSKITNVVLRKLKSGCSVTDGGLTARKQVENGPVTLYYTYRRNGVQRWYRLGRWGAPLTLSEARAAIRKLAARVATGVDVQGERLRERSEGTVLELCHAYLRAAEAGKLGGGRGKKASTLARDHGRIVHHIDGSTFGSIKVGSLTRNDIQHYVDGLVRDVSPAVGRRVGAMLGGILTWAVRAGIIATSPHAKITLPADAKRERFLSPDEYRQLWAFTCGEAMPEAVRQNIRFLMVTGWRRGEASTLRFDQVSNRVVQLPATKSGASRRWLSAEAARCVEIMRADHPGDLVFPVRTSTLSWWIRNCGIDRVSAHTLRHSYATTALSTLDHRTELVARLIGHIVPEHSMTRLYSHSLDADMLAAADRVSAIIERMCMGIEADVVALRCS
jgi:integrase